VLLQHTDRSGEVDQARLDNAHDYLRQAGLRHPLATVLTADGARLDAQGTGAPWILGAVLAAATECVQTGDWKRMKGCGSPPCEQAFVDRTRNQSARFCAPRCASRASMRAMRQQQGASTT
jgi:predicted RNA-binding Zn ribbon-like protein